MSADNLRDTIEPKSDQLNADDLLGGPITIKVTAVKRGSAEQPVTVNFENDNGRPYKPCKSMRRVLIACWGDDGAAWVGKMMALYCDPEVKFGGVKVGGIRISHLSHIDKDMTIALTVTRGKREPTVIRKLPDQQAATPAAQMPYPVERFNKALPAMREKIASGEMTAAQVIAQCEKTGRLTDEQKSKINAPAEPETNTETSF